MKIRAADEGRTLRLLISNSVLAICLLVITFHSFAQPTIANFSPASGPVGTPVTITGTNFSTTPANNIVFFGATQATVTNASSNSLDVIVPMGATYQPISVNVGGLTAYSASPFIVTFGTGATIDACAFAAKVDFASGVNPYGVALGDLDGDGKTDMAVSNYTSSTVSIFRNTSVAGTINAGSFAAKVDLTAGTNVYGVDIADLDADGKLDLVVANYNSDNISVFKNTSTPGTISFAAKVDFTKDKGRLLENIIYLFLRQKNFDLTYFREQSECDFVVFEKGKCKMVIQVCEQLHNENKARETKGLLEAMAFFGLKSGIIITQKQKDVLKFDKQTIELVPAREFMMEL